MIRSSDCYDTVDNKNRQSTLNYEMSDKANEFHLTKFNQNSRVNSLIKSILMITAPSAFSRNSDRKKNSGINSLTSVADSNDERRHVVAKEWKVRSGMSKLRSIKKTSNHYYIPLTSFFHDLNIYLLCNICRIRNLHISHNTPCLPSPRPSSPFSPPYLKIHLT